MSRLPNEPGIHFERFGIAYTKIDSQFLLKNFTTEIAIKPTQTKSPGFNLIMSIHDGDDSNQLIIGQWKTHVVIMNGDDYSNKRKIKRITAEIFNMPYKKVLLTITTGEKGTELFINGELVKTNPDLHLMFPGGKEAMLTLGNSVYGNNPWSGTIYGFALYGHYLSQENIKKHYQAWEATNSYKGLREEKPLLFFDFDKNDTNRLSGFEKGMAALKIPECFPVLVKQILSAPWKNIGFTKNSIIDITINLIGFIPLGFILYALVYNFCELSQNRILFIIVIVSMIVSLLIEITQAWIPSRSSQSLDLILNTAGGYFGGVSSKKLLIKSNKIKLK